MLGAVGAALIGPGVAQAREIDQAPECACQVFARYMDQKRSLRTQWDRWVNADVGKGLKIPKTSVQVTGGRFINVTSIPGMGGRTKAGEMLKGKVKEYATDKYADQKKACDSNEFVRKVCKAAKACIVVAAGTLYGGLQAGQDFWDAERAALVACQIAIVTAYFGS